MQGHQGFVLKPLLLIVLYNFVTLYNNLATLYNFVTLYDNLVALHNFVNLTSQTFII